MGAAPGDDASAAVLAGIPQPAHQLCYVTTWFEKAGFRLRSVIGVENIMWGSEFPRETSTWPESAKFIDRKSEGIPDADRERILFQNAADLYKVLPVH